MPPFVSAECTNSKCKHKNRYDLAELKKDGGTIYKGSIYRAAEGGRRVDCHLRKMRTAIQNRSSPCPS